METIVGNNIILRPIQVNDTDNIVKWRNTDFVRNNFIFRETFTNEMHMNWLKTKVFKGQVVQYIIETKDTTPIGSVYYRDIIDSHAEFGIFIGEKEYLGRGIGQEAMKLFIQYGLDKLGLNTIYLRVIKSNDRALHVYEKIGFKEIREEKQMIDLTEEFIDIVFMVLEKK